MNSISIAEPSLSSRAMLCSLSISIWSARKHDPDASQEIAQRHGAQSDAGRYHKVLLPKEALAEVQKIVSDASQEHYFMTLPWDDNGYRVLPSAAYMDHTKKMRELSSRFTPAVDALAHEFGNLVEQAKVRLGGLFRPEDYPAPDELRSKFSFETKVMPLPDAGDFRVTLGDEERYLFPEPFVFDKQGYPHWDRSTLPDVESVYLGGFDGEFISLRNPNASHKESGKLHGRRLQRFADIDRGAVMFVHLGFAASPEGTPGMAKSFNGADFDDSVLALLDPDIVQHWKNLPAYPLTDPHRED